LLTAYARDPILRITAPLIQALAEGTVISRQAVEEAIEAHEPGRFSPATLRSVAQNTNSSWTKSGHLIGTKRKTRSRATATAGSVSYALLLGYLMGVRGQALFETEYSRLLDCPVPEAIDLAVDASRRGWLVFKRVADVIEVLFPNLLAIRDTELVREQA